MERGIFVQKWKGSKDGATWKRFLTEAEFERFCKFGSGREWGILGRKKKKKKKLRRI